MTFNNPLGDLFARIRNASITKFPEVIVRRSKFIIKVLNWFYIEGYIRGFSFLNNKQLVVKLKYIYNQPLIKQLDQVSTPSKKFYFSLKKLKRLIKNKRHLGDIYIISTSQGLLTLNQCILKKIGGILIFKIV